MDKEVMLEQMISHYSDGNKARFARILGIKPQTITTWLKRNSFDTELIYAKCEGISAAWLLSGEGDMIATSQQEQPVLPARIHVEPEFEVERRALSRAKAKVVVEFDLDDDEFVKLGLSSKVVQILKQK